MLDGAGDDVVATAPLRRHRTLDREVVRLGRAAGEGDLRRRRADQRGDLRPRRVHGVLRFPAPRVLAAGGVAELLGEVRQHRLEDAGIDGRRGVVVEIEGLHWSGSPGSQVLSGLRLRIWGPRRRFTVPGSTGSGVLPRNETCETSACRGTSDAISASETVSSAMMIRSLIRQSGSRTLQLVELLALLVVGRAGGDGQRSVDRLDDVGDRDRRRRLRQRVAAARALMRGRAGRAGRGAAAPWRAARAGMLYSSAIARALVDAASVCVARCFIAISA